MTTTNKDSQVWEQATIDGLCLTVEREATQARDLVYSQFRLFEDDLPELMRALDGLNLDLTTLGKAGDRLLQAIDALDETQPSAYTAHLDAVSKLEGLLEDLYEVRSAAQCKEATGWRVEMMRELYDMA